MTNCSPRPMMKLSSEYSRTYDGPPSNHTCHCLSSQQTTVGHSPLSRCPHTSALATLVESETVTKARPCAVKTGVKVTVQDIVHRNPLESSALKVHRHRLEVVIRYSEHGGVGPKT